MSLAHLSRHDDDKHRRLIYQLRAVGRPEDRRLANVLARCTEDRPCRSAACIHCGRDFQQVAFNLVEGDIRAIARREYRGRLSAITVVPTMGCLAPEGLTTSACQRVADHLTAIFEECRIDAWAMSLDVSFNEDETGNVEPHWCVHGHAVTPDWLSPAQIEDLKKHLPKSPLVSHPVRVVGLDGRDHGKLYSFKPDRVRRVSFINNSAPNRRPHRDTKRRALRAAQAVALAHVEHTLGFDKRLIFGGIDENAVKAACDGFYRARDGP